jgi:hypothetical protein
MATTEIPPAVGESSEEIPSDSISQCGHSIVVWQGATKHVRQSCNLSEASETTIGKARLYRPNKDPKELASLDEPVPVLERTADRVAIDASEGLHTRDSVSGSTKTKDQLKTTRVSRVKNSHPHRFNGA